MSDTATETQNTSAEATEAPAEETKSKKDPLPDGFLTPVGFGHLLAAPVEEGGRGVEVRPQQIYGYVRNNQAFKENVVQEHTDGRVILNVEKALQWWDEKEQRRAEREAAKAAKEKEEAKAAKAKGEKSEG